MVNDLFTLWSNLEERYDHQKIVILPKARYDWMHLRLQDFKTISEYNSALFTIGFQLKLCEEKITEENMLEKTFTMFYALNVLLQQQYLECRFTKYCELISCLLVTEQNNELLMMTMTWSWSWKKSPIPWFFIVIIHQILRKGKSHCTTRSRIILRQNKKMGSVYKINLLRTMRIIVIDVA